MDLRDLDEFRTVEELLAYQQQVRDRITALDNEFRGLPFPDEAMQEFGALREQDQEISNRVTELRARIAYVEEIAAAPSNTEDGNRNMGVSALASGRTATIARTNDRDLWDLSTIRSSLGDPESATREVRARALRAVEISSYPHPGISNDVAREAATNLIENHDDEHGTIARRILVTGSPVYQRAWGKALLQQPLNDHETRALSLTGASGGFAVPFVLDPTIIPTSNGTVNVLRAISRVIPIPGDEWRGVSSAGVTAAYAAEATETTDNAPTLAQPTISTEKAQAFIPFSIEIGMDWNGLQSEMAQLLSDSKDELEAAKFISGTGTNEPFGLLTGITNTVNAAAGQTFTLANLYSLMNALPPRYRPNAAYMGNLAVQNRIRQFDTAGGAALWVQLQAEAPERLLGKRFYEASDMADVATSVKFLVYGDFSRFVIVDRVGLQTELIPHLVGTNHRPTGQRGIYAFWRNSSKVVDANGFRALLGVA